MSDELDIPDEMLDSMVSEALGRRTKDNDGPSDEDLVRYASGDLDASRSREIASGSIP